MFAALVCLSACGRTGDNAEVTASVSAGATAAAADGGTAGRRAAAGGEPGRATSTAGRRAAGPAPAVDAGRAGASAAGSGGSGGAAGTPSPSAVGGSAGAPDPDEIEDAGVAEVDAAVSCDGEIVSGPDRCLQDDAFCYPLGDGRYCTGPSAPPKSCGARAGDTCKADEYCAYQPGQLCGQADAQAFCQPRPNGCTGPKAAVCGCDQRTYPSACEANTAGVGIFAEGACQ